MLQLDRHTKIYDYLKQSRRATVNELADLCYVAPMTIRRDLDKLEEEGLITRVFGGAVIGSDIISEVNYEEKEKSFVREKNSIAKEAANLVKDNSVVVLDSGTTCMEIAKELVHKENLRIITTDILIAAYLMKYENIEVYCTGGRIQSKVGSCIDSQAAEFLNNINAHICFLGASAINEDFSISTFTVEKSKVKQAIMKSAYYRVLVTDNSKFNKRSFSKVCNVTDFDLVIMNEDVQKEIKEELLKAEVNLRLV